MVNIQSPAAEIRRGKKRRRRRRTNHSMKIYMVSLLHRATIKSAARGSLKIQDAKNCHLGTIAQLCRAISSQLRHVSTIGKKLVKQQYLLHMS